MLYRPRMVEHLHSKGAMDERIESLRGMGYSVNQWRKGYRAVHAYYGKWWLHLVFLFASHGIFNAVYLVCCLYGDKTRSVYLMPTYTPDAS